MCLKVTGSWGYGTCQECSEPGPGCDSSELGMLSGDCSLRATLKCLVGPGYWSEASPFLESARLSQCHRDWLFQSQQSKTAKSFNDEPQKTTIAFISWWDIGASSNFVWKGNKSMGLRRRATLAGCHHCNLVFFAKKGGRSCPLTLLLSV